MIAYQTKLSKLPGTDFREVHKKALEIFADIKRRTKRKPYLRSAYFHKQKIFFDYFWIHLFQKSNWQDRVRRLKYFPAAIELIQKSRNSPHTRENPHKRSELLHRFAGLTRNKEVFFVQIKENKRTYTKQLMSIFPPEK